MVIDSSAILAIIFDEPTAKELKSKIRNASTEMVIPAPILLETLMVLSSRVGADARADIDRFVLMTSATVTPFSSLDTEIAFDCFQRFGKGRHPAGLNFADCMAYAVAKVRNEDLLCVGNDFSKTDISIA